MTAHETAIAGVFRQPQEEQWRKLVDRALKGASIDSLVTKAYGAVTLAPLYPRAAAAAPKSLRRTPGRWSILGRVDYAPPEPANRLALDDLEGALRDGSLLLALQRRQDAPLDVVGDFRRGPADQFKKGIV